MSTMLAYYDKVIADILLRLTKDYRYSHRGKVLDVALPLYVWWSEKRKENRIIGALSENNGTMIVIDADYRASALFVPAEYECALEISAKTKAYIEIAMNATEAIDLSTILIEALLLLKDVTAALKDSTTRRVIIALDPVQRSYIELAMSEFERVRYIH